MTLVCSYKSTGNIQIFNIVKVKYSTSKLLLPTYYLNYNSKNKNSLKRYKYLCNKLFKNWEKCTFFKVSSQNQLKQIKMITRGTMVTDI